MAAFFIFIRDALIAVLLSWVGIEVGRQDKPAEPAPDDAANALVISSGLIR